MSFASVARRLKRQDDPKKVGYYRTFKFALQIQIRNFSPCTPNVWQSVGLGLHAPYCQRPMPFQSLGVRDPAKYHEDPVPGSKGRISSETFAAVNISVAESKAHQ